MKNKILILILTIGIIYKLLLTSGGNFIFNMDNARDMVDVREMVVLKKLRLIAHTSSIEGVFYGPAWYYLSSIPFILTDGDPYGSIILVTVLWFIGGFFLLKIVSRFGFFWVLLTGILWIASDFINLATLYAFNPNPVILLAPLFFYLLEKYINSKKLIYSCLTWFLGGVFFNFQMNFSVFIPLIIVVIISLYNRSLLRTKNFWIGFILFLLPIMPQVLFDIKHQFIMTKSLVRFITVSNQQIDNSFFQHSYSVVNQFYQVISGTFMNQKLLTNLLIFLITYYFIISFKKKKKDLPALIPFLFILIPLILFLFLPVTVASWHIGSISSAAIILAIVVLHRIFKTNFTGKIISSLIGLYIIIFSLVNIISGFEGKINNDPSLYRNQIAAVDYVYNLANKENFKVFVYMPSVYDYPYQYLFWWYGKKKYGFIPYEYAYLRNKPQYIASKQMFEGSKENFNGLVFLIMEPDTSLRRAAWLGDFDDLKLIKKEKVGTIEIETRMEERY